MAIAAAAWHGGDMSKVRIDVMIDAELLERARVILSGVSDSSLIATALRSLLAAHRHAEVDAGYQAYDDRPLDTPDAWGNLATWGQAKKHA